MFSYKKITTATVNITVPSGSQPNGVVTFTLPEGTTGVKGVCMYVPNGFDHPDLTFELLEKSQTRWEALHWRLWLPLEKERFITEVEGHKVSLDTTNKEFKIKWAKNTDTAAEHKFVLVLLLETEKG